MLRFGEIAKEKFCASKKPIKIWNVNVDNVVISKLVKTKTNSKYLIGLKFYKAIRPLVLIMLKMSGYVKTFKVKKGDRDKSNKLMSFHLDNEKLLQKCKAIWTIIENLKNIKLNALQVYDDRYIKTKIRTYGNKPYTYFRGSNMPEDDIECEPFTVISIDSLFVFENKYYLQVYSDNCDYKIVNKRQIILMKMFLKIRYYKCCYDRIDISEGIDLAKSNNSTKCMICHYGFF